MGIFDVYVYEATKRAFQDLVLPDLRFLTDQLQALLADLHRPDKKREESRVARMTIDVTPEQLAELPPEKLKLVLAKVADREEVREWMRLGESGFQEWLTEPDLYADDRPAR